MNNCLRYNETVFTQHGASDTANGEFENAAFHRIFIANCHCPQHVKQRLCNCPASVRLSVRPSVRLSVGLCRTAAARRCCGFATVGPEAMREISVDCCTAGRRSASAAPQHGTQQQMRAVPLCQLSYGKLITDL